MFKFSDQVSEEGAVNGEDGADKENLSAERALNRQDVILISGQEDKCEAAKNALLVGSCSLMTLVFVCYILLPAIVFASICVCVFVCLCLMFVCLALYVCTYGIVCCEVSHCY